MAIWAAGCSSTQAQPICTPDLKRCQGSRIEVCSLDGNSWVHYQQCTDQEICKLGICTEEPEDCGDGSCTSGEETCLNCEEDCGDCCGNGSCEPQYSENQRTCSDDCSGPAPDGPPRLDGGVPCATWNVEPTPPPLAGCDMRTISGTSPQDIYVLAWCSGEDRIAHFDGNSWALLPALPAQIQNMLELSSFPISLWAAPGDELWLGFGDMGSVRASTPRLLRFQQGAWEIITLPEQVGYISSIWGTGADDVYCVDSSAATFDDFLEDGSIFHFDGESWSRQLFVEDAALADLFATSDQDVFAVGNLLTLEGSGPYTTLYNGTLWRKDGSSWEVVHSLGDDHSLRAGWGSAPDDLYLGGDHVYHSDGVDWSILETGMSEEDFVENIWGPGAGEVFVAIGGTFGDGQVLHLSQGSWEQVAVSSFGLDSVEDVWGTSSSDVYAVCEQGLLRYSCP